MTETKSGRVFFDTNVLLYADDKRYPDKQEIASHLIRTHRLHETGVVSLQVLQEFFSNGVRKLGLEPSFARRKMEIFSRFHLVEPEVSDVFAAADLSMLRQISYWDALIVHCARKSGCQIVLTEGLHNGQIIDGVKIVNPFV
jgi:predicted nucleic acid-binding protein